MHKEIRYLENNAGEEALNKELEKVPVSSNLGRRNIEKEFVW